MISMSRTGGALKGQSFSGTFVNVSKSVKFYAGTLTYRHSNYPSSYPNKGAMAGC